MYLTCCPYRAALDLSAPDSERRAAPTARLPEQAQVSGPPAIPLRWPAMTMTWGPGIQIRCSASGTASAKLPIPVCISGVGPM